MFGCLGVQHCDRWPEHWGITNLRLQWGGGSIARQPYSWGGSLRRGGCHGMGGCNLPFAKFFDFYQFSPRVFCGVAGQEGFIVPPQGSRVLCAATGRYSFFYIYFFVLGSRVMWTATELCLVVVLVVIRNRPTFSHFQGGHPLCN